MSGNHFRERVTLLFSFSEKKANEICVDKLEKFIFEKEEVEKRKVDEAVLRKFGNFSDTPLRARIFSFFNDNYSLR